MGAREARAVEGALGPDNVDFPDGLSMQVERTEGGLAVRLEGDRMAQLASTADEVLGHVQAALGAIR